MAGIWRTQRGCVIHDRRMTLLHEFLLAFVPLFVAVDPVGVAPIYFALTHRMTVAQRRHMLRLSILVAAVVSVGFALLGKAVFVYLGITVSDFQIAGGLILLGIAGLDLLRTEPHSIGEDIDLGAVPLGVPLIAGPAVITTTIVFVDLHGVALTIVALLTNLALCWLVLARAQGIERLLGRSGARALAKIMSLLLAAIAVRIIRQGLGLHPA